MTLGPQDVSSPLSCHLLGSTGHSCLALLFPGCVNLGKIPSLGFSFHAWPTRGWEGETQ